MSIKKYRNKNIGEFLSIPVSLIDESSVLDTLYLSLHFDKLRIKSVTEIRGSNHYASTISKWTAKLNGVECSDLNQVAEALQVNIKVFNPLAVDSRVLSGGTTKRNATLLKVKKGVYKPINIGGTSKALAHPRIIHNNQTKAHNNSGTVKVRPLRNVIRNTNRRQGNKYTITEVFKFKSLDGSDIDMTVIANSISRESITPEMILTYLLLGDAKCTKGVPMVSNFGQEEDGEIFAGSTNQKFENQPLLVSRLDSNLYTFIYGSTVYVNLDLLFMKMSKIEYEIHMNYDIIHVNSTQPVFYSLPQHNFVSDEYSAGAMGRMGTGKVESTIKKSTNNSLESKGVHFEYLSKDSGLRKPRRHVIKATMKLQDSRTIHRVIKIAVNKVYDEEYLREARNYKIFKGKFPEFYEENVLKFYGTGMPNFAGEIQFEDDNGEQVMIGIPMKTIYEKRRFFVTEFNPAYVTMRAFLESVALRDNIEFRSFVYFTTLEKILKTAYEANQICSFTHGDFHWDNVFVDTDREEKPILFDFDFSSFGPKVEDKVMHGYGNIYLAKEYKSDNFEMKYTWYLDAIRMIFSMPAHGNNLLSKEAIDNYSAIVKTTDDPLTIEVKYLIETVHDMIPKNSEQYRKLWHMVIWNGDRLEKEVSSLMNQQSHSFVSAVKVTHDRKMLMFKNMEAIQNSLLTMCAEAPTPVIDDITMDG